MSAVGDVTASETALQGFLAGLPPLGADVAARAEAAVSTPAGPQAVDAAIACIDLTSLRDVDTPEAITDLCRTALRAPVRPAAVCTWPDLAGVAATALHGSGVRVASVAGAFPSGRSPRHVKVAEVTAAIDAGADEVDVVMDRGAFLAGRYGQTLNDLLGLRQASEGKTLKVILETAQLPGLEHVRRAAWLALLAGAEFVKTSTGRAQAGATPGGVAVLWDTVAQAEALTGRRAGVKASGGIRTAQQALGYAALIGPDGLEPRRFRFGASGLLDALLAVRTT